MTVDVVTKVGELIDLTTMTGIEIGALHSPRLPRGHPNVRYLDHATRDELAAKYAENPAAAPHAHELVDVDYVWQPGLRLLDVVGDDAPLDFVIASHVIEHIPNPIGWLGQIAEILRPGGVLSLVVPDKRYCFDSRRQLTTSAELVDVYLAGRDTPTAQQIYDHESNFIGDVNAIDLWNGLDPQPLRRQDVGDPDRFAYERCLAAGGEADYVDVHCSTFTPTSFVDLYETFVRIGLLDFELVRIHPTEINDYEFFVTLEKAPDAESRREDLVAGARARLAAATASNGSADREVVDLSRLEARAVDAKRRVVGVARDAGRRLRR